MNIRKFFLTTIFLLSPSLVYAIDILDTILRPFGGINVGTIYLRYASFIDAVIYLVLFLGLSQFVLTQVYGTKKEGKAVSVAVALALTFAMTVLELRTGFNLGKLFPIAAIVFLAVFSMLLFNLLKALFNSAKTALCFTILIMFGFLVSAFNVLYSWMMTSAPLLIALIHISLIGAFICALLETFTLFKGDGEGDKEVAETKDEPKTKETKGRQDDKESEKSDETSNEEKQNEKQKTVPSEEENSTNKKQSKPRSPGVIPTPTPRQRNPRDPPTDPSKFVPGIKPGPAPKIPREPKRPPVPEEQQILIDLSPNFNPIRSQNGLGACTAFAACSLFEYLLHTEYRWSRNYLSTLYLWYKTREDLGVVADNTGPSNCATVMNNLKVDGVCFENIWTFEDSSSSKWTSAPPSNADADAAQKKIVDFRSVDKNDPDQFVRALMDKYPLNIAIFCPRDFQNGPKNNRMYFYSNANPSEDNGHAMVIVGYHSHYPVKDSSGKMVGVKAFKLRNSWDVTWGENGYIWVSADTLKKLLIEDPIIIKGHRKDSFQDFKITGRVVFDFGEKRLTPEITGENIFNDNSWPSPAPDKKDPYYVGAMAQINGKLKILNEICVRDRWGRFSFDFKANPAEFEPLTELKKGFKKLFASIDFEHSPPGVIVFKRHKQSEDKEWFFHIVNFDFSFGGRGGEGARDNRNPSSHFNNRGINHSGIPITFKEKHTHELNVIIPICQYEK